MPDIIWLFCVNERIHKFRTTPKIGELSYTALLGWEAWLTARLPRLCYRAKFGSSATNDVRISRKEPSKLGIAGTPSPLGGACLTQRNRLLSTCYPAKFGRSRSKVPAILRRCAWEFDPSCPAFQCHSRS